MTKGICRVCGCTDDNACITDKGSCSGVFPDLCSACVVEVPAGPNEKLASWLVEKMCRFCANLAAGPPYKGKATWTCSRGRFDGKPKPGECRAQDYHRWFSWSGIWRPNQTVKAAQNKCPCFAVFDRFHSVCQLFRLNGRRD